MFLKMFLTYKSFEEAQERYAANAYERWRQARTKHARARLARMNAERAARTFRDRLSAERVLETRDDERAALEDERAAWKEYANTKARFSKIVLEQRQ